MSSRWYPLYQQGNPQLRIFLPNFWMKLVTPEHKQPKNVVTFHCSIEMTKFDVKNYLEKIYDVHPIKICTRIALGKTYETQGAIQKKDDTKIAYVTLPKDEEFTFPSLFPSTKGEEEEVTENYKNQMKQAFKDYTKHNKIPCIPSWFMM